MIPEPQYLSGCQSDWFVFYPKQNTQYFAKSRQILSQNGKNV
ncbi:hypothetical protein FORC066_3154 [Yersinia enterocolitica]|nr:hypothetical protein FORC065_1325 [Yersinia enterocolitica]UXD30361.1 hypothetical protein FORC066_3154 [Yersinia enterocolitica]